MGEADTIRGVWRTALAIIGRYPLAVLAPAAVLGVLGKSPPTSSRVDPCWTRPSPW
ncbi:MAG: hypothetical protein M3Q62_14720 [Actinomycetota bacterium]|nr:hypothetical protein [Actinomycetota bacterium]MDQ3498980.1 hypothetical protein [Actinomycetota bacterium]